MAKASSRKKRVDFSGTDKEIRKGGGRVHIPEGEYLAKIITCDLKTSEDSGSDYYSWRLQVHEGKYKGKTLFFTTSLKTEALWNLRNLIHAATGKNVAGKKVDFDPEKIYGKIVGMSVEDHEYKKKITSQVQSVFPKDELEESDDDEDDDEEDDDEEEEEDDDEDLEEVDVEEI